MKNIIFILLFLLLGGFIFAQDLTQEEVEELMLKESGYYDLTQEEKDNLEAIENGEVPGSVFEYTIGGTNSMAGADCFDYYKFGSVDLNFTAEKEEYSAGQNIVFNGLATNNNDYPIVHGYIYAQIYRLQEGEDYKRNGGDLITEFFAVENITMNSNTQKQFEFEYRMPAGQKGGKYMLATHYVIDKKMNLSGVSFLENVDGGITYFDVKNKNPQEVMFDKNSVVINGEKFEFRNFSPTVSGDVKVEYKVIGNEKVSIIKTLYEWDNLTEGNKIEEKIGTVSSAGKVEDILLNLSDGVYLYELKMSNGNSDSMMKIRFSVGESADARINFLSVNDYPLRKDKEYYYFSCFHSMSNSTPFNGRVLTELLDKQDKVIDSHEYIGEITPSIMAYKQDFKTDKDMYEFKLKTSIYDYGDNLIEEEILTYDCTMFESLFDIGLEFDKNVLKVKMYDACNKEIKVSGVVQIEREGEVVYLESDFHGYIFEHEDEYEEGEYVVTVLTEKGEIIKSVEFSKDIKGSHIDNFYYILIGIFLLIIGMVWYRKNNETIVV